MKVFPGISSPCSRPCWVEWTGHKLVPRGWFKKYTILPCVCCQNTWKAFREPNTTYAHLGIQVRRTVNHPYKLKRHLEGWCGRADVAMCYASEELSSSLRSGSTSCVTGCPLSISKPQFPPSIKLLLLLLLLLLTTLQPTSQVYYENLMESYLWTCFIHLQKSLQCKALLVILKSWLGKLKSRELGARNMLRGNFLTRLI